MTAKERTIKKAYEEKFRAQRYEDSNAYRTYGGLILSAMEEYAKKKCKEQKELCRNSYITAKTRDPDDEMDAIENAPEPKFD